MEQSHSSSSSSSQHYATLLATVGELRTDLEKAVNRIQELEQQNHTLSDNYQTVKTELVTTRKTYLEAKERYMNAVAEKFEAERQRDAFIDRLKGQLIEKTKEFESIRDKLIPHDIDQLRIKIQEELELQHKGQLSAVEYQKEQERLFFSSMKREYERGKSEYEVLIQHQQHELQALRKEYDEVQYEFSQQLIKSKENLNYIPSKDEKIRNQRVKIIELNHLIELLREEMKTIRNDYDSTIEEMNQSTSTFEATIISLKGRVTTAEVEKNKYEERLNHLILENDRKDNLLKTLRLQNDELIERHEDIKKTSLNLEKQLLQIKDDHNKVIESLYKSFDNERLEFHEQMNLLNERLQEKEENLKNIERLQTETIVRTESTESELRRTHQLQIQELRKKYNAIEIELVDARTLLKTKTIEELQNNESNKFEIENLRSELSKIKREKDLISHKIKELELVIDTEKRKFSSYENTCNNQIRNLESSLRTAETKISSYETKLSIAREAQFEAQNSLQITKEQNKYLEMKLNEQVSLIDAMKVEFKQQIDARGPSFKEQTEQLKKKMKLQLAKEKKRAEAYKGKAVEAHHRVKALAAGINIPTDEIALLNS